MQRTMLDVDTRENARSGLPLLAIRRRLLPAVTPVVFFTACVEADRTALSVSAEAESGPEPVAFVISRPPVFFDVAVRTCGGVTTMWAIRQTKSSGEPVLRIRYGTIPNGFSERRPAIPLAPGCYVVNVSGPASARFVISDAGTVAIDTDAHRAEAP